MVDELLARIQAMEGMDHGHARSAAQVLFRMARAHFSPGVSQSLFDAIPGSQDYADAPVIWRQPANGIDAMMSVAVKNVLGVTDPLVETLSELKSAGLNSSQSIRAGAVFIQFAHDKAGPGVVERMTQEIPGLSRLG